MNQAEIIAKEIMNQLGNGTLRMLGALNFVYSSDKDYSGYLTFKIRGSKKFTHIKIALNSNDQYDVTFYKCGRIDIKDEKAYSDICVSELKPLITENTGLYTNL